MKHKNFLFILATLLAVFVSTLYMFSSNAKAYSFNSSRIIDDGVFDNTSSLSVADINNFLNKFPRSCLSTNNGFSSPDPTGYNPTQGFIYGKNVSGGQVIYDAAQAYDLNPQVIIATLEKESSVVTGEASYHCQYLNTAMGYDCPDSGACPVHPSTESGFSKQVIWGAWLLKRGEQRSEGNVNWAIIKGNWDNSDDPTECYGGPMTVGTWKRCSDSTATYFDGYTTIDGKSIYISNGATATLYWYTPHFSGNENFYSIFTDWFGSTYSGPLIEQGNDGSPEQYVVYNGYKYWITNLAIKNAWGFGAASIVYASYLDSLPNGNNISSQFARDPSTQAIYPIDSGRRYHFVDFTQYSNWGNPAYVNLPTSVIAAAKYYGGLPEGIMPQGSTDIYLMDNGSVRHVVSVNLLKAWQRNTDYATISTALFGMFTTGADITSAKFTLNGHHYMADSGVIHDLGLYNGLYNIAEMTISADMLAATWPTDSIKQFVKTSDSPAVYAVDSGSLRHITSPDILNAWSLGNGDSITTLSDATLATIPLGSIINGYVASDGTYDYVVDKAMYKPTNASQELGTGNTQSATTISTTLEAMYSQKTLNETVRIIGESPIYQLINGQKAHYLSQADFKLWQGPQKGTTVLDSFVVDGLFPNYSSTMSALFTDGTNDYVMADYGKYYLLNATQETQYGLSNLAKPSLPGWVLAEYINGGSFSQEATSGSNYYLVAKGAAYSTASSNLADLWGIKSSTVSLASDFLAKLIAKPLGIFIFVPTDGQVLLQNHDNLLHLTSVALVYDLGYSGHIGDNMVVMDSNNLNVASASSKDYGSPLIKDTGGAYYVVDKGEIRSFADDTTQSQWIGTDSGIQTVSLQLLTYMPSGSEITKSVKDSHSDKIYAGVNQQLHWIESSVTYHSNYSPYTNVSPQLISAMPQGTDIP